MSYLVINNFTVHCRCKKKKDKTGRNEERNVEKKTMHKQGEVI